MGVCCAVIRQARFDAFAYTMHVIGRQAGVCETRWVYWSGQPQRQKSKHVVDTLDDDERTTISLFPQMRPEVEHTLDICSRTCELFRMPSTKA